MNPNAKQHGATLLVALIMLVVLTLLVVSAIRSANTNMRIAGNMQMQEEATASAQQAVEQVISNNFWSDPVSSVVSVDINNDGATDYRVDVAQPACTGSVPLMNSNLVISGAASAVAEDAPCISSSTASNTGLISASGVPVTTGQSWCFAQQWDIEARATSVTGFGADVTSVQGVALRVPAGTLCH